MEGEGLTLQRVVPPERKIRDAKRFRHVMAKKIWNFGEMGFGL